MSIHTIFIWTHLTPLLKSTQKWLEIIFILHLNKLGKKQKRGQLVLKLLKSYHYVEDMLNFFLCISFIIYILKVKTQPVNHD